MRRLLVLIFVLLCSAAYAQDPAVVQIATERDANGKYINPTLQAVTWDTELTAEIGDHWPIGEPGIQEWYIYVYDDSDPTLPYKDREILGYRKFTFDRQALGVYAIRYHLAGDVDSMTDWSAVVVTKKGKANPPVKR